MQRSTVGSLLRSTQAHCLQLCDKQTLEYGIAYSSTRFPGLPEAQQYREVIANDAECLPRAFDEAEAFFRQCTHQFHIWAPANGEHSPEVASFLDARGFVTRAFTAFALTDWVEQKTHDHIRVLPARAMRSALHSTFLERDTPPDTRLRQSLADACDVHLDDPQYDLFLAMVEGQPAGRCALYQVGDIARVMDLTILPPFADSGADNALVAHALALAKRLEMRNICTQHDADDTTTRAWLEQRGFTDDGQIVEFHRRPLDSTGSPSC